MTKCLPGLYDWAVLVIYLLCALIGGLLVLFTLLLGEETPGVSGEPGGLFRARLFMVPLAFFGIIGLTLDLLGRDLWICLGLAALAGLPGGVLAVWLQRLIAGDAAAPARQSKTPARADPDPDRAVEAAPSAADVEPSG